MPRFRVDYIATITGYTIVTASTAADAKTLAQEQPLSDLVDGVSSVDVEATECEQEKD